MHNHPRPASPAPSSSTASSLAKEHGPARRGLRQKARDVVSDLGAPPTTRQDAKDGKPTLNFVPDTPRMANTLDAPVKI
ncbi:hypothetical protein CDD83_3759 [Cordyceps sp. RAO-2017]|nr:hypothetical protein CDD83_3759 [Cordyceps sp. RAO-2017]